MTKLIAVVNHIGGRLLITPEQYRRGQWQLWQQSPIEPQVSTESWPQFVGAAWWRLSDGSSVRGEAEARRQQALLEEG